MGTMCPVEAMASDPRFCALDRIGHTFDVAITVSYKIVTNGCGHCLFIMFRGKYNSADEEIRRRVVKAFEDGEDWRWL